MATVQPASTPSTPARTRIESLSDGVFAIALTLLTLNVRLDLGPHETFAHAFGDTLPQLFAYVLSFAVIALFWIGHHRFFATLATVDHGLVLWNFVYLGVIALIPFPSQVLGNTDVTGAVVLYAAVLSTGGLVSAVMWEYARRRGLLESSAPATLVRHSEWRALVLTIVFALSIPIALVAGPHAAQWSWALVIPARLFLRHRYGSVHDVSW